MQPVWKNRMKHDITRKQDKTAGNSPDNTDKKGSGIVIWYIEKAGEAKEIPEEVLRYKIENDEISGDNLVVNDVIRKWVPLRETQIWKDYYPDAADGSASQMMPPPLPRHTWRCETCGHMISETPCKYCSEQGTTDTLNGGAEAAPEQEAPHHQDAPETQKPAPKAKRRRGGKAVLTLIIVAALGLFLWKMGFFTSRHLLKTEADYQEVIDAHLREAHGQSIAAFTYESIEVQDTRALATLNLDVYLQPSSVAGRSDPSSWGIAHMRCDIRVDQDGRISSCSFCDAFGSQEGGASADFDREAVKTQVIRNTEYVREHILGTWKTSDGIIMEVYENGMMINYTPTEFPADGDSLSFLESEIMTVGDSGFRIPDPETYTDEDLRNFAYRAQSTDNIVLALESNFFGSREDYYFLREFPDEDHLILGEKDELTRIADRAPEITDTITGLYMNEEEETLQLSILQAGNGDYGYFDWNAENSGGFNGTCQIYPDQVILDTGVSDFVFQRNGSELIEIGSEEFPGSRLAYRKISDLSYCNSYNLTLEEPENSGLEPTQPETVTTTAGDLTVSMARFAPMDGEAVHTYSELGDGRGCAVDIMPTSDLSNVKLVRLILDENATLHVDCVLDEIAFLSKGDILHAELDFGDITNRGVAYVDGNGKAHVYGLGTSGYDGSIYAEPIALPDVSYLHKPEGTYGELAAKYGSVTETFYDNGLNYFRFEKEPRIAFAFGPIYPEQTPGLTPSDGEACTAVLTTAETLFGLDHTVGNLELQIALGVKTICTEPYLLGGTPHMVWTLGNSYLSVSAPVSDSGTVSPEDTVTMTFGG